MAFRIPDIPDWNEIVGFVRKFLRGSSGDVLRYDSNGFPQKVAFVDFPLSAPQTVDAYRATDTMTINKIYAIRDGGTGAEVNVRKNGSDLLMAADLSVGTTWTDGGVLQNNSLVDGDYLEIMLVTVTGDVTDVVVQLVPA